MEAKGELVDDDDTASNSRRKDNRKKRHSHHKKARNKQQKNNSHSLDHLKQRISDLVNTFEEQGLFIPPAGSMSEKGKVWSSRIYGADKKRQRKNTERLLLEDRIEQLEYCLHEQHGIST